MSDNEDTAAQPAVYLQLRRSELPCFVVDKCNLIPVDQLVEICTDFYQESEIMTARAELNPLLQSRLPRRSGTNKCRATMEDIVKTCLNPAVSLPQFYAVELTHLPPVGASHCDVSAILTELQALRAEVREVSFLQEEVAELRAQLYSLMSTSRSAVQKSAVQNNEFPALSETRGSTSEQQRSHDGQSL